MTLSSAWHAAVGGALIGLAASLTLFIHGRIAGISGTIGRVLDRDDDGGFGFRIAFLAGMITVGLLWYVVAPAPVGAPIVGTPQLVIAGLLVGVGTTLSNGCTSGHGVCGLSRGSRRSLAAVATFMATAAITVAILRGVAS